MKLNDLAGILTAVSLSACHPDFSKNERINAIHENRIEHSRKYDAVENSEPQTEWVKRKEKLIWDLVEKRIIQETMNQAIKLHIESDEEYMTPPVFPRMQKYSTPVRRQEFHNPYRGHSWNR